LNDSNINDYEDLINKLFKESNEIQTKYDRETLHGNDEDTQKIWEAKIGKELLEFEDYASDHK
jgi:hypothetical protein